jgi:hypothetical protein
MENLQPKSAKEWESKQVAMKYKIGFYTLN